MARTHRPIEVVVLVASAGGLEAFIAILSELPTDLPFAVVVQQHLSEPGSQLVPILTHKTAHSVAWARDGDRLEPGRILVTPARRLLELRPDGTCTVGDERLPLTARPHDMLLASAAASYGARALAVVLSGMGSDGAAGVRAMTGAGAVVVAQSPDSAAARSMPESAIAAGAAPVLDLRAIAAFLTDPRPTTAASG
ncbi:chemotaxis protein CheB [Nakamurella sp. YIM 132087]|uniref:protein-glutamate methylesterase n=1 Tax=Nakamurella alba TaxID=2665158 RepID=A0A7K1FKM9_9ACTN|nr:chemotaxis protein CheB [Nakamurella alba]MTD14646.1 chemotaxis protein CheB [Nakamurella alba]